MEIFHSDTLRDTDPERGRLTISLWETWMCKCRQKLIYSPDGIKTNNVCDKHVWMQLRHPPRDFVIIAFNGSSRQQADIVQQRPSPRWLDLPKPTKG